MKKIIFVLVIGVFAQSLDAQSIRKPWEEFTNQERIDYVDAINALSINDVQNLANEHAVLFQSGIHGSAQFLPWHRIFLEYFEELLQDQNAEVTIPYWDWHDSWSSNALLFRNSTGGNTGILGYNVDGSVWEDPSDGNMFSRGFTAQSQPADSYKNASTFSNFTNSLQFGAHNIGHQFVGGDMVTVRSPIDPVFYIHHGMVDKAWSDWFNANPNADVSLLSNNMPTFNGYPVATMDAETIVDPRVTKLWYADNNELLLNNYSSTGTEDYKYTTGEIIAEDFIVPNGSDVQFTAVNGRCIFLKPGFHAQAGSDFLATLVASSGKRSNSTTSPLADLSEQSLLIYPNPNNGSFVVDMKEHSNIAEDVQESVLLNKQVNIEVLDLKGVSVLHINEKYNPSGVYKVSTNLVSGIYIVNVYDGDRIIKSSKIIVE